MTAVQVRAPRGIDFKAVEDAGAEVKLARKGRGWSQAKLAQAAGVDVGVVKRIEGGRWENSTKLGVIQKYLGIGPYAPGMAPQPAPTVDLNSLSIAELARYVSVTAAQLSAASAILANRVADDSAASRPARTPAVYDPLTTPHLPGPPPRIGGQRRQPSA